MDGLGSISVQVVADHNGRPVKGANVVVILINETATYSKSTVTDRHGRALLLGVAPGRARVTASHSAFLSSPQAAPGGQVAFSRLEDGQHLEMSIRLKRAGAIAGYVTNEAGEPMIGLQIEAFRRGYANGKSVFTQSGTMDLTDDRGAYRLTGLPPGEYLVGVVPRYVDRSAAEAEAMSFVAVDPDDGGGIADEPVPIPTLDVGDGRTVLLTPSSPVPMVPTPGGRMLGYAPTFYPGTSPANASLIPLGAAEQREGVNFRLDPVPVVRVSGSVQPPANGRLFTSMITLVPASASDRALEGDRHFSLTGPGGTFSFPFVPQGQYTLEARTLLTDEQGRPVFTTGSRWASVPLSVEDEPIADLVVPVNTGMAFTGHVRFRTGYVEDAVKSLSGVRVQLSPQNHPRAFANPGLTQALKEDGTFEFRNLMPGAYALNVTGLPYRWQAASAMFNGGDLFDVGLRLEPGQDLENVVVTVTDRMSEVSGVLRDASGLPTSDGYVIVFPTDRRHWTGTSRRVQGTRPDTDGSFAFLRSMPPGEYLIVAADAEPGQWQDPAFLATLVSRATPFTLGEAEKVAKDVKR